MKTETTLLTKLTIPLNSQTSSFIVVEANYIPLISNKVNKKLNIYIYMQKKMKH